MISVVKRNNAKFLNICGFTLQLKKYKDTLENFGSNNEISLPSNGNLFISGVIDGNNNKIIIDNVMTPSCLRINIKGDNNTIYIKSITVCHGLVIDIGNYTGVDNSEVFIGGNFYGCNNIRILVYQHKSLVRIGDDNLFAQNVCIRSGELPHIIYDLATRENLDKSEGIFIGNKVWVGENTYIMKKVTIPNNTVIGTASVVTKRFIEEYTAIAGNPARICRKNVIWDNDATSFSQRMECDDFIPLSNQPC